MMGEQRTEGVPNWQQQKQKEGLRCRCIPRNLVLFQQKPCEWPVPPIQRDHWRCDCAMNWEVSIGTKSSSPCLTGLGNRLKRASRLAVVLVLQTVEGLTDRQAAL